ncbi:MAG TPA: MFS transporter [Candidatus Paceibacterota bacterium]
MNKKLKIIYLIGFCLSTAYAFTAYINSTYLESFVPPQFVGLIFSAAALLAVVCLSEIPKLLSRKGNYKISFWLTLLFLATLLGLSTAKSPFLVVIFFLSFLVLNYLLIFTRDIFIQSYSNKQTTGETRGVLLTAINIGWIFAPLIATFVLEKFGYRSVYILAIIFSLPTLLLLISNFGDFKDQVYEKIPFWKTIRKIMADKNIRDIYFANFLLQFFYSWMVIYTPIYLHEFMNFSWTEIGFLFVPMLLPFVLLQYPLGKLSDKIGEKKMLYGGFAVMAVSTTILSFLFGSSIFVWALLLFMTRVGAATIEVMTESYFFKKVSARQDETISFFRNTAPISFILGPILAGIFFFFFPFQYLFLALGIIMLLGIYFTKQLKDTV